MENAQKQLERLTRPFWLQNTMYDECAVMIRRADGSITAKLLFPPVRIIEVRDCLLQTVYREGTDYIWDGEHHILLRPEGSSIPYFTPNDLAGIDENGEQIRAWGDTAKGWTKESPWDGLGRSRFQNALYCIGAFLYEKQFAVTYEYAAGAWQGPVTPYQGERLPHTLQKLTSEKHLHLCFYGDSIFTGCDASAMYDRPPYQESFPELVKAVLSDTYGAEICLSNPSVAGMDSVWGAAHAEELVAALHPDLVYLGFGMNDIERPGNETAANIQSIMDTIRRRNPACEFVVVVPMVPNAAGGFLQRQKELSAAYAALTGEGTALADMFAVHTEILKWKDFSATSGNNINHPNDWLIRVYAMQLLSVLVKF